MLCIRKYIALLTVPLLLCSSGFSQTEKDLFKQMEKESDSLGKTETAYASAIFKTTRIINGHSVANTPKGIFDLRISHRFGTLNQGLYELFGLDNASMRMGADFGVSDNLTLGFGRSTYEKQYDAFLKWRLLRQSSGLINMPITLTYAGTAAVKTLKYPGLTEKIEFSDRLYISNQLLLARKFNEALSLQLVPTWVMYNATPAAGDPKNLFSLGVGGRQKISKRISLNVEYYYQFNELEGTHNSLSAGFDIETGGHVFQLNFTNSTGMTERTFITDTRGTWENGDIHFGFTISRVFVIGRKAKALKNAKY